MPAAVRKQGDKVRVINKDTHRIEKKRARLKEKPIALKRAMV